MASLLLRHLLESTLFCLLLGLVAGRLRRQGAAERHTLWLIGISKFLIPTFLLTAIGARIAFVLPAPAWVSAMAAGVENLLVRLFGRWPSVDGHLTTTSFFFLAIWGLGSAMMFAAWLIRLRMSYDGLAPASVEVREALDRAKRRFGFDSIVHIRFATRYNEPVLIGIFQPIIVIPQELPKRLINREFEAVLLHELAHARRGDNLAAAFVHAVVSVFWFYPLLWFFERRLIAEREHASDEAVIRCGIAPEIYLASLAKVCRFHVYQDLAGVSAASGSNLTARFDQILACRSSEPIPYLVRALLTGVAFVVTLLPIAGGYCEQCGTSSPVQAERKDWIALRGSRHIHRLLR